MKPENSSLKSKLFVKLHYLQNLDKWSSTVVQRASFEKLVHQIILLLTKLNQNLNVLICLQFCIAFSSLVLNDITTMPYNEGTQITQYGKNSYPQCNANSMSEGSGMLTNYVKV